MYFAKEKIISPDDTNYNKYGVLTKLVVDTYVTWLVEAGIPHNVTVVTESESAYNVQIILYDRIRLELYNSSATFYCNMYNMSYAGTNAVYGNSVSMFRSSNDYNFEIGLLATDASVSFIFGNYVKRTSSDFTITTRNNNTLTIFPFIRSYTNEDLLTFGYTTTYGNVYNLQPNSQISIVWLPDPTTYATTSWSQASLTNSGYDGIAIGDFVNSDNVHYIPNMIRIAVTTPIVGKFSDGENTYLGWWTAAARIS